MLSIDAALPVVIVTLCAVVAAAYGYRRLSSARRQPRLLSSAALSTARWRRVGRLQRLWLYPVKSCGPLVGLPRALAGKQGLSEGEGARDRSFIIVNDSLSSPLSMVTGRMCPQSVLITPSVFPGGDLQLTFPGREACLVRPPQSGAVLRTVRVWADTVEGVDCGDDPALWLSAVLSRPVRLLRCTATPTRRVTHSDAPVPLPLLRPEVDGALYADLTEFMLLTEASVQELQRQCGQQLTPLQFRPNFVVSSDGDVEPQPPYAEDAWDYIKVGDSAVFRNIKPCTRCVFTTVDPYKGKKDAGGEPLKTLKRCRLFPPWRDPLFGINLAVETPGHVAEGDLVYTLVH